MKKFNETFEFMSVQDKQKINRDGMEQMEYEQELKLMEIIERCNICGLSVDETEQLGWAFCPWCGSRNDWKMEKFN